MWILRGIEKEPNGYLIVDLAGGFKYLSFSNIELG
jgi:hypothetical protein